MLAAARLAVVHDEEGTRFLREIAEQPGANQLFAARLMTSPENPVGIQLSVELLPTVVRRQRHAKSRWKVWHWLDKAATFGFCCRF